MITHPPFDKYSADELVEIREIDIHKWGELVRSSIGDCEIPDCQMCEMNYISAEIAKREWESIWSKIWRYIWLRSIHRVRYGWRSI